MADYNLQFLVKITVSDKYKSNRFYYRKSNCQPFKNLFRKKENKIYKYGWCEAYDLEDNWYDENNLPDSNYFISDGVCYLKPLVSLKFIGDVHVEKTFNNYVDAVRYKERIKAKQKNGDFWVEI